MFPEPDKKEKKKKTQQKLAKTCCIINYNYQLPHHFIQFSFCSCQEQKEPHSVKALSQENGEYYFVLKQFTFRGTWAEPLKTKVMVNHIPFMHSYFGLGFFPKLAHNMSFPWTAPVLAVLNTFLPTILLFFFSFLFLFRSLVLIFSRVALSLPIFLSVFLLPLYRNKSGICLEPDDSLWLSETSACFLQGGPCFGSEKSIPGSTWQHWPHWSFCFTGVILTTLWDIMGFRCPNICSNTMIYFNLILQGRCCLSAWICFSSKSSGITFAAPCNSAVHGNQSQAFCAVKSLVRSLACSATAP